MNDYNDMTISEKLTCFVDGELAPEESGDLFIELAKNPEYQEELRQLVLIKNTFKNSIVSTPPALKSNVMKRTVYRESPLVKLSNAVAMLIGFALSKNSLNYAGLGLIALSTIFLVSDIEKSNYPNNYVKNNFQIERMVPEVKSREIKPEISSNLNSNSIDFNNKLVVSNLSNKPNTKISATTEDINSDFIPSKIIDKDSKSISHFDVVNFSEWENSDYFDLNIPFEKSPNIYYKDAIGRFLNKLSISVKKFDGNSSPNFNIGTNTETIFNNISLALNYKLDYYHSFGIIVGFENFLMDFEKYEGEILYNYRQSYNTQWFGLQYSLTTDQLGESGIRPNFNLLAGATNVGPIIKLGAGITYHVSDYFAINGGIESGWLFYPNNGGLSNSTWFNTHKFGYNIGFDIGL